MNASWSPGRLVAMVMPVALAACALGQAPTGATSASPAVTVLVVARDLAFDPGSVELPTGTPVAITLDNRDPGILHNIAILASDGSALFRGETFAGIEARTYHVAPLPDGQFRFVCDVHPGMEGTLIVQAGA